MLINECFDIQLNTFIILQIPTKVTGKFPKYTYKLPKIYTYQQHQVNTTTHKQQHGFVHQAYDETGSEDAGRKEAEISRSFQAGNGTVRFP